MGKGLWCGLALVVAAGCSNAGGSGIADEPVVAGAAETGAEVPADLSPLLVLRATQGFARGDTVHVDLGETGEERRVFYYERDGRSGSISLDVLGVAGAGAMVVSADELKVRRCRSTGCSVVGYLVRGQVVEVRDFVGRWYRLILEGKAVGYVMGERLRLPLVSRIEYLEAIADKTAAYYDRKLKRLRAGPDRVFSGYDMRVEGDVLGFEFYTPFRDGPALQAVCEAMRGIAAFVRETMSSAPSQLFPAYSAGVYQAPADGRGGDGVMLAGLTGDGGVYCSGIR